MSLPAGSPLLKAVDDVMALYICGRYNPLGNTSKSRAAPSRSKIGLVSGMGEEAQYTVVQVLVQGTAGRPSFTKPGRTRVL